MPHQTFLFYDIESTGLSKPFDQVLQFAAIRTDASLNELERYEHLVQLTPGVVPSAYASITHRTSLHQCQSEGAPEWQAISDIHGWMNEPGTLSGGYNTLGFDDEFLRFSFYRHLLTPYTHQYAGGCGRFDLYPMVALYANYAPGALDHWPTIDGKPTLKLEHLSQANGLATGMAHHAMTDVEATVALARRLRDFDPQRWDYALASFNKAKDQDRVHAATVAHPQQLAVLVSGQWGSARRYQVPALALGGHQVYRNQTLWLRMDVDLASVSPDAWPAQGWLVKKKWAEPPLVLPWKPRFCEGMDQERVQANLAHLKAHEALWKPEACQWLQETYPDCPTLEPTAALYQQRFWSDATIRWCQDFHQQPWEARMDWLKAKPCPDQHVQLLAIRLCGLYAPETLDAQAGSAQLRMREARMAGQGEWTDAQGRQPYGLGQLMVDIEAIRAERELDGQQQALLAELELWAQRYSTLMTS